jgi:hypothetical protein
MTRKNILPNDLGRSVGEELAEHALVLFGLRVVLYILLQVPPGLHQTCKTKGSRALDLIKK